MKINIDDLSINYLQSGSGQDVLLLHGWGCSIETMMPIFNILKDDFRVTVIDLPGFGDSSIPQKVFNSFDYADAIKKFIDALSLSNIILFGHSHGGRISIILASSYKNLINKLILIDSSGIIPKRTINYYVKVYSFKVLKKIYLFFVPKNRKEQVLEEFYKKHGSTDYQDAQGIMRKIMVKVVNDNLKYLLKEIVCPTLLIWGELDDATPLYMAKIMEKEIPNCGLVIIKGGSHYSYIDDYNTFKIVINSFLNIK